jgi:cytochrome P450
MTTDLTSEIRPEEFYEFVLQPELRTDPYPFYRRLQTLAPAHRVDIGAWLVSSYDFVSECLRSARFSTDESNSSLSSVGSDFSESAFGRIYERMMLFRDEPDHKRLRDLVQKAFTRKVVEDLRERIDALVEQLLTSAIERGTVDLMADVAYPLPVIVICELLGVPASDRERFQVWARDLATRFEIQPLRTPESEERGDAATASLAEYFDTLIETKRREPGNDLVT